jgi:hypothetical protein
MTFELVSQSRVRLTVALSVRDLQDEVSALSTVGEAMTFIDANFSAGRKSEDKWAMAAAALRTAAATDTAISREIATQAVMLLLESEGMLERS